MPALAPPELPLHLILPLAGGMVYVVAALLLKRATEAGVSVWRSMRVCNVVAAVGFAPLWLLGGNLAVATWWQAAFLAALFFLGQMLTLQALRRGEVSVTTPVLGVKVILVAALSAALLQQWPSFAVWAAAILSSAGIGLLQFGEPRSQRRTGASILLAGLAAACYALLDVLVQKWAPAWGAGRLLPLVMGFAAMYSLPLGWRGHTSREEGCSRRAWAWMLAGAGCLALQAIMFVLAVATYRNAAVANVLYSSRGLWSVVAVWLIGHWFANRERHQGPRVMAWRLAGAAMLMTGLLIVLLHDRVNGLEHGSADRPGRRVESYDRLGTGIVSSMACASSRIPRSISSGGTVTKLSRSVFRRGGPA